MPRRPIDFRALRERIPIQRVLELIHWEPQRIRGMQLRGQCPFHEVGTYTKSRIFSVNLERNAFQCFAPRCGEKGNQLDLWCKVAKLPVYDASEDLAKRLGVELPFIERGGA